MWSRRGQTGQRLGGDFPQHHLGSGPHGSSQDAGATVGSTAPHTARLGSVASLAHKKVEKKDYWEIIFFYQNV